MFSFKAIRSCIIPAKPQCPYHDAPKFSTPPTPPPASPCLTHFASLFWALLLPALPCRKALHRQRASLRKYTKLYLSSAYFVWRCAVFVCVCMCVSVFTGLLGRVPPNQHWKQSSGGQKQQQQQLYKTLYEALREAARTCHFDRSCWVMEESYFPAHHF